MMGRVWLIAAVLGLSAPLAWAETLFNESTYQPLVSDHRAGTVGDVLTVLVYEVASASASANSDSNAAVGVGVSASDGHTPVSGNLSVNNDFEGGGNLNRNGKLVARVSVTVKDVLPNGDLWVSGEQLIEFNNEKQNIRVKGKVRPLDISSQNTVLSTRLADADIEYVGEGLLTSGEEPGIITRFFNWLF
jgi:flagellar L-ring protein precursor FlgH